MSVPLPTLTNEPVPDINPENVVLALLAPTVATAKVLISKVPAPLMPCTVTAKVPVATFMLAPVSTNTVAELTAVACPNVNVPADTVVPPV